MGGTRQIDREGSATRLYDSAMAAHWVEVARQLAASIADFAGVAPRERWLNDRLLEFVFEPSESSSATMTLIASSDELLFFAGCGARFELDGPESASAEAMGLARAVASGRLTERVRWRRVRFEIELEDGAVVSGSSSLGPGATGERGIHVYAPYGGPTSSPP
jgi:hypothetical protein